MTDILKPFQRLDYQASIDRPKLQLPGGKRVAVYLVVNIERWDIDRTIAQFERLYEEAADEGAKVMGLAVHPYISGVPHRIGWFERVLTHLASRPGTVFMQGRQIMDWYNKATA